MGSTTLSKETLLDALVTFIKFKKNDKKDVNHIFCDKLVDDNDVINYTRLEEIANDPVYRITYLLIKYNTIGSGRTGENIPSVMSELINPFIKYPFNKYLIPLFVLATGNYISHTQYWSMKIKIKINIDKIGEIVKSDEFINLHKK